MRSLNYKDPLSKTTWEQPLETVAKAESTSGPREQPQDPNKRRFAHLHKSHWERAIKHGWSKV